MRGQPSTWEQTSLVPFRLEDPQCDVSEERGKKKGRPRRLERPCEAARERWYVQGERRRYAFASCPSKPATAAHEPCPPTVVEP